MGFIRDAANWLTGADDVIDSQEAEASRQDLAAQNFQNLTGEQVGESLRAQSQARGDVIGGYGSAAGMLDPYRQQGARFGQMYGDQVAGGPGQVGFQDQMMGMMGGRLDPRMAQMDPELMQLAKSPIEVGPLEETAGYGNMLQAREQAMGDLATSSAMGGKTFSGSRMKAASDISGQMAGDLYDKEYNRATQGRQTEIANRMGLGREQFARGMDVDQTNYLRGQGEISNLMGLGDRGFNREQSNLNRMQGLDQRGYNANVMGGNRAISMGGQMANMGISGQRYNTGLTLGGQQYGDQLRGMAGANRMGAAQTGQGALGDLWGAAGALGGKFIPDDFLGMG